MQSMLGERDPPKRLPALCGSFTNRPRVAPSGDPIPIRPAEFVVRLVTNLFGDDRPGFIQSRKSPGANAGQHGCAEASEFLTAGFDHGRVEHGGFDLQPERTSSAPSGRDNGAGVMHPHHLSDQITMGCGDVFKYLPDETTVRLVRPAGSRFTVGLGAGFGLRRQGEELLKAAIRRESPLVILQLARASRVKSEAVETGAVKVWTVKTAGLGTYLIDQADRGQDRSGGDADLPQPAQARAQARDMVIQPADREGYAGR